jgi:hypothetical protein
MFSPDVRDGGLDSCSSQVATAAYAKPGFAFLTFSTPPILFVNV